MSLQAYEEWNPKPATVKLIDQMNAIIVEYVGQGLRLTARQLYYQLVARDVLENVERNYKLVTGVIDRAKRAGLMDWEAIEDRTRAFIRRSRWEDGASMLRAVAKQYHMDMWDNQHTRVFVVVEKEALAGVLESVCFKYDVPLLAARGYPSGTVLREFAIEDLIAANERGQGIVVLHLGDHDPSGIDMTRDLRDRLFMFAETEDIALKRIALNMDQIQQQKPPPNPAKSDDPRFKDYTRKYGGKSWELDALKPSYLSGLVEDHIGQYIDEDQWEKAAARIASVKLKFEKIAKDFKTG